MVENKLSSVALYSNFVLAVDVDLVVDMGLQLLGLDANHFGQKEENSWMHPTNMNPKPSLKLE